MRIQMKGKASVERITVCVQRILDMFPEGTEMNGINLYVTFRDQDGEEISIARDQDGEPMDHVIFNDPKPKTVPKRRKKPKLEIVGEDQDDVPNPKISKRG